MKKIIGRGIALIGGILWQNGYKMVVKGLTLMGVSKNDIGRWIKYYFGES